VILVACSDPWWLLDIFLLLFSYSPECSCLLFCVTIRAYCYVSRRACIQLCSNFRTTTISEFWRWGSLEKFYYPTILGLVWGREGGRSCFVFMGLYKKANNIHVPNAASPVGTKIWSLLLQITWQLKCQSVLSVVTLGASSQEDTVRQASTWDCFAWLCQSAE